jgi:hypothetical protein
MKTPNGMKRRGAETLKEKYLRCFGVRTDNAAALQEIVKGLIDEGVSRKTLVGWAVQAGYSKGYVSSLLSRVLCSIGLRERRAGAGRRPSPAALELVAHAQDKYGEQFLKVLRAAWRAGKAQATAQDFPTASRSGADMVLIVAPQLQKSDRTIFKRNLNAITKTRHRTRGKL